MKPQRTVKLGDAPRDVEFDYSDLCRHTLVFGSSGSGKTTRLFNPLLREMLGSLGAGGFIICAKAEAVEEVVEIARLTGRQTQVVMPGSAIGLDLLSGNPDLDSMYFRDTYGNVEGEAKQWVEAAVQRMKNALRMLKGAGEQYYTFGHLTSYCFDEKFASQVRIHATDRLRALDMDGEEGWTINEALDYENNRFMQFSPEARRSVMFAVSQLLEPLRDYALQKTFSRKHNLVSMDTVFDGKVIVLHVPRSRYQRAASAIYTLAKRRFFTAVENRRANPLLDQTRPIAFAVDEYQLCISASDVDSLGIVRSAGCMVLATTQGVSSLYTALPRDIVDAALQNFTQKFFFKTDDHETLATLVRATQYTKQKFDPSELFSMHRNQAIAHVTTGDRSTDTILDLQPLYVSPDHTGRVTYDNVIPLKASLG
jgi:hypothetical protein